MAISYASVIALALENCPDHRLALRDIYEYFRKHAAGLPMLRRANWQHSIRHILTSCEGFYKIREDGTAAPAVDKYCLWAMQELRLPQQTRAVLRYVRDVYTHGVAHAYKQSQASHSALDRLSPTVLAFVDYSLGLAAAPLAGSADSAAATDSETPIMMVTVPSSTATTTASSITSTALLASSTNSYRVANPSSSSSVPSALKPVGSERPPMVAMPAPRARSASLATGGRRTVKDEDDLGDSAWSPSSQRKPAKAQRRNAAAPSTSKRPLHTVTANTAASLTSWPQTAVMTSKPKKRTDSISSDVLATSSASSISSVSAMSMSGAKRSAGVGPSPSAKSHRRSSNITNRQTRVVEEEGEEESDGEVGSDLDQPQHHLHHHHHHHHQPFRSSVTNTTPATAVMPSALVLQPAATTSASVQLSPSATLLSALAPMTPTLLSMLAQLGPKTCDTAFPPSRRQSNAHEMLLGESDDLHAALMAAANASASLQQSPQHSHHHDIVAQMAEALSSPPSATMPVATTTVTITQPTALNPLAPPSATKETAPLHAAVAPLLQAASLPFASALLARVLQRMQQVSLTPSLIMPLLAQLPQVLASVDTSELPADQQRTVRWASTVIQEEAQILAQALALQLCQAATTTLAAAATAATSLVLLADDDVAAAGGEMAESGGEEEEEDAGVGYTRVGVVG